MFDAFGHLLCSKLRWHNWPVPTQYWIGISHFRPQMYQYQIGSEKVVLMHH